MTNPHPMPYGQRTLRCAIQWARETSPYADNLLIDTDWPRMAVTITAGRVTAMHGPIRNGGTIRAEFVGDTLVITKTEPKPWGVPTISRHAMHLPAIIRRMEPAHVAA